MESIDYSIAELLEDAPSQDESLFWTPNFELERAPVINMTDEEIQKLIHQELNFDKEYSISDLLCEYESDDEQIYLVDQRWVVVPSQKIVYQLEENPYHPYA